jgi:hypothetical protein
MPPLFVDYGSSGNNSAPAATGWLMVHSVSTVEPAQRRAGACPPSLPERSSRGPLTSEYLHALAGGPVLC